MINDVIFIAVIVASIGRTDSRKDVKTVARGGFDHSNGVHIEATYNHWHSGIVICADYQGYKNSFVPVWCDRDGEPQQIRGTELSLESNRRYTGCCG